VLRVLPREPVRDEAAHQREQRKGSAEPAQQLATQAIRGGIGHGRTRDKGPTPAVDRPRQSHVQNAVPVEGRTAPLPSRMTQAAAAHTLLRLRPPVVLPGHLQTTTSSKTIMTPGG